MHPNEQLLTRFYQAFDAKDADTMVASYTEDAVFEDPAFGRLSAHEVRAMWRMLLGRSSDLRVECRDVHADDVRGSVHWEAHYTFNGRPVHNVVDADFEFRDGRILHHRDSFDWPRWAGQALGLPGRLFGRTRLLRNAAHNKARAQLEAYIAKHGVDGG